MGTAALYALSLAIGGTVIAEALPDLRLEQIKITSDDQFVTIANQAAVSVDLSRYELVYFNADNKPTKTFTFSGSLAAGSYYVMSDALMTICYGMQVDAVSLDLSTTAGTLQLWKYDDAASKRLESSVAWVKSRKADTPITTLTLPATSGAFLQRMALPSQEWQTVQPSATNPCQLEAYLPAVETDTPDFYLLPSMMPPVSYVVAPTVAGVTSMNRNQGKMAPLINEVLPNPASPLTDADDEFVELYNPNDSTFDLSGFKLAYGSTTPKQYTFPEGTVLAGKEFRAFTSGDTSISLSNSLGQIWLLAPNEQLIHESKPYQDAKEGAAWALDNGSWVWTISPSPSKANTIQLPATSTNKKGATTAAVLGISGDTGNGTPNVSETVASAGPEVRDDAAPLHPAVLAGIGVLALGYAIYEYRNDLSNRLFQFRRYLKLRRAAR